MNRKGAEGFENYYSGIYGDRWPELRASLLEPARQVARVSAFADPQAIESRAGMRPRADFMGSHALLLDDTHTLKPEAGPSGLLDFYFMDAASIFPPAALGVQEGEDVLDLCAAPGGKSLILAEKIGEAGSLVANEMSDKRRGRLRAVIEDYVPRERRERVRVTGHDGTRWCLHETDAFDRILIDAPCSGERHLLANPEELKQWSPARTKNLAVRQYALLASSLAVVRPGGRIVYSTCSISPAEDDAVIARLLKKREGEAKVLPIALEIGEPTEHGWAILPDRTGFGPIYLAAIERI